MQSSVTKAMATQTNFLVRGVVQDSRAWKSNTSNNTVDKLNDVFNLFVKGPDGHLLAKRQKTLSEKIRKKEHVRSIRFPRMRFLNLGKLDDIKQHLR